MQKEDPSLSHHQSTLDKYFGNFDESEIPRDQYEIDHSLNQTLKNSYWSRVLSLQIPIEQQLLKYKLLEDLQDSQKFFNNIQVLDGQQSLILFEPIKVAEVFSNFKLEEHNISAEELAEAAVRITKIRQGLIANEVSTLQLENLNFEHYVN